MLTEIVTGISAAKQAAELVKELRDIDRSVDEATFKLKLAELTEALADTKIALSEAKIRIDELEKANSDYEAKLANSIPIGICPKCEKGKVRFESKKAVTTGRLDVYGVEKWTMACDLEGCDYSEAKIHDPAGVVPKNAKVIGR